VTPRRPRHVAIVPHTHWDREWYEPFQSFRLRLVRMLDTLIPLLESDPSYARFLLDGQMAVVDDYLEVRPENEERIRALAAARRLSMGPWYILMDEFLVSGETIVRNLQSGMLRGAAFGGAMEIGYLPDMFGHIAQMPQILRLAGFEHAVVWRGAPKVVDRSAFVWEAPDGSSVRAEYLPTGYGNGASIPDDAKALVHRIADHETEIGDFLVDGMLFMNGTDHQSPQPWLGRVVAEGLASAGADVVVASRKVDNCEAAANEIAEATGRRTLPVGCHVGKWEDCDRLVTKVYDAFGRCDVLVNNAGMSPLYDDLISVTEELYDKTHAVNARGPFRLSALVGSRMAQGDGGSIINVTTAGSLRPNAVDLPYAMAKAGLNALTLGLAGAWAPKVRANLVLPGAFDTDITKAWAPGMKTKAGEINPMKRIGHPQDMVGVCVFLASDASSYVNGAQILVDGGLFRTL